MKVICLKPTTKLIKGAIYRVVTLNNLNTKGYAFFRPTIRIYLNDSSIQTFPISNFKPIDSDNFANVNWICPDYALILNEREQTKIDKNLKAGDYVVPLYDNLKTLIKGRKYKVKEVKFSEHKNSAGYVSWTDIRIKLDGSSRFYASWNFRKCSNQEVRDIGLSEIFDESTNIEKVNKYKRKFDYFNHEEKKKLLLEFLVESANDRFRHQMDIIEWAVSKSGAKYKLSSEDFDLIIGLNMTEILEILK